MARKSAAGSGTVHKKTVTRNGKQYTYWEARYTTERDPDTGRQVQRSITGRTQEEVAQKLKTATATIDTGTYITPAKMTIGSWLDVWATEYLGSIKPATATKHRSLIKKRIRPALGAVSLPDLRPHMIQQFVNGLGSLSPTFVRLAYKILHQSLRKAVRLEYISRNPAADCELPRTERTEIHPLSDEQVAALLQALKGSRLERLISVTLFTGRHLSGPLDLTWGYVDFTHGILLINKQLVRPEHREKSGLSISPKSGKSRTITPTPSVFSTLREQRGKQAERQLLTSPLWDNPHQFVFASDVGYPLCLSMVGLQFHAASESAGLVGVRSHDLRHTYAINAIRTDDDIRTIQGNLDHVSAAFTLDRYGHFTKRMRQNSAARMEDFIKASFGA